MSARCRDGTMDHEEYTQCEYGPHTGIWRILRMLEEDNVKTTFLTCGGIAERFPEAVKAIVAGATKSLVMATTTRSRAI